MVDRPMIGLLHAPSSPVSAPLFLFGRLAKTPDAGAIWPQRSQEGRCLTAPKERETSDLTWLLSTPNIVFINEGQNALTLPDTVISKTSRMHICSANRRTLSLQICTVSFIINIFINAIRTLLCGSVIVT